MADSLHLTQALCTRLCHDLAGPIGAVAAGVELIGDDPSQVDGETLQLISSSSSAASQKLKFLRLALGAPGGASTLGDFKSTLSGYLSAVAGPGGAARVTWPGDADYSGLASQFGAGVTQVLANLILMAIEAVPRVNELHLTCTTHDINVESRGEVSGRVDPRQDLLATITNPSAAPITPKSVQPLYAVDLATRAGLALSVSSTERGVRVSVKR